jgi:hypothetical protein
MSGPERDALIVRLRRQYWTFKKISKVVGMTPHGVLVATRRIAEGRPGRDPRAS